jgi:hypothetical protein
VSRDAILSLKARSRFHRFCGRASFFLRCYRNPEFHIGDPALCELIVQRDGDFSDDPAAINFYLACHPLGTGVGPAPFPLGRFLASLGLTAADCAAALAAEPG